MSNKYFLNEKQYKNSIKKTKIIGIVLLLIGIISVIISIFLNDPLVIGILGTLGYTLIMIGGSILFIGKSKIYSNKTINKKTIKKIKKNTKIMDYDEIKIMEDSLK